MICDLHAHSTVSDGMLAPGELVELAARCKVRLLALTDHDDVSGIPEARARADELGLELLPGVELSVCEDEGRVQLHLLGLGVDVESPELLDTLARVRERRRTRAGRMIALLAAAGVELDLDELSERHGVIGRPHLARALVRAGACASPGEAFGRWLGRGRPAYVKSAGTTSRAAIAAIHAAGGIACLAHAPLSSGVDAPGGLDAFVERLLPLGLDGVEVEHPGLQRTHKKRLRRIARQHGLLQTRGSDYHGDGRRQVRPGHVNGPLELSDDELAKLRSRLRGRGPGVA